ncbi:hypothetical protein ANCDUO_16557 [Ancylostoma duodenale]|uniref:RNA-directed DNA polymerase n=1 Tax=Ancylostoma duodenale TaxID=51022 RepID=A0A0C2CAJ5_9BILA|nr:hypothetical protein ANCDUO_16557 [Ancylostoma duodenale]
MPMRLKGAPAAFQRIMDNFKKHLRARVFTYTDDLIITSDTPEEYLVDIDEVLTKIEQIEMKLKTSKCEFAREEIKFLSFILSKDGIKPNPEKTKAIDEYPTLKNRTDIKAFLELCSFFRRFVHNSAPIASPLAALTKKDTPFIWTPECETAMILLKQALTTVDECPWIVSYKGALENEEPNQEIANYTILNGVLYKLPERLYQDPQIVRPENSKIKHELIKQVHESNFDTAHLGIQKTRAAIAKLAIRNEMSTDIANFVKSCPLCQLRKNPSVYRTSEPSAKSQNELDNAYILM